MKLLFLTNIPSPYRVDFFNELGKMCDLTVTFERNQASDREEKWYSKDSSNFKSIFLKGINYKTDFSLSVSIIKILIKKKYDLIIVGGYSSPTSILAILYLNITNKPYILNADGGVIKKDSHRMFLLKKYLISSAFGWLSTGAITDQYLKHYGANKEKIYRYPFTSLKNGDLLKEIISPHEKKMIKKNKNMKEEKIILAVGQIIHRKGYDVLINACKDLEGDVGIYIVGGEPTNNLKELLKLNRMENVHFINFMSKKDIIDYYRAADLFVLPTREDIWGLVVNEAMAQGLPIITTDKCNSGIELIENSINGYIVPSENTKELSEKIQIILYNKELRDFMGKNNLVKIKKYTIEEMAKMHKNIFEKILSNERIKVKSKKH